MSYLSRQQLLANLWKVAGEAGYFSLSLNNHQIAVFHFPQFIPPSYKHVDNIYSHLTAAIHFLYSWTSYIARRKYICVWLCCTDTIHRQKQKVRSLLRFSKYTVEHEAPVQGKKVRRKIAFKQQFIFLSNELASQLLWYSSHKSVFGNVCNIALCRKNQLWISWLSRFTINITGQFTSQDDKEYEIFITQNIKQV